MLNKWCLMLVLCSVYSYIVKIWDHLCIFEMGVQTYIKLVHKCL